jgi:hypothetical protein
VWRNEHATGHHVVEYSEDHPSSEAQITSKQQIANDEQRVMKYVKGILRKRGGRLWTRYIRIRIGKSDGMM